MAELTVLLLIGLSLTLRATLSPAQAADTAPAQVSVQVETLSPLSPGPKDTLRITGRVFERSGASLTQVQVSLHLGNAVTSRTELHGLRAQPVAQGLVEPPGQQDVGDGKLSPGHALPFTLSVKISDLNLPGAGVYPIQVTAIGKEQGADRPRDLDAASTFLPYIPSTATRPATPLAWLVPLAADPSQLADGTFTGVTSRGEQQASIVAAVEPGGRLRTLLDALGSAKVATATLDPTVVQALASTSSGRYRVAGPAAIPTSKQVSHSASAAAASWLADLRAAGAVKLIGLPYADPDVEALLHAGQPGLLADAAQRASQVLKLGLLSAADRLTPTIAVPPSGAVDAVGLGYYQSTVQAKGLVLRADSVAPTGDNPSASAAVPGVTPHLLLADDVLTKQAAAGPGTNPRMAEQQLIAELAEAHLEDRVSETPTTGSDGAAAARPLLIAPPSGWSPSAAWLSQLLSDTGRISWLEQVPVSGLLAGSTDPRAGLTYPAVAAAAELPPSTVDAGAAVANAAGQLFPRSSAKDAAQPQSPASVVRPIRDTALATVSSRWRGRSSRSDAFLQSAQASLLGLQQQVRVAASPQVTLTSRSGRVPVTLENDLPAAVDVSLVLTSLDKSRVSSDTIVRRTVRAGQKVQVEVEVKAASAGTFPVRLALFTPDGLPLGVPAQVLVRSTTYGVVATVFTIVALSVLGLAVLIRALRGTVRRSRRRRELAQASS